MNSEIAPSGLRACPTCSHAAAPGRRFCGRCRAVLVRPCSACGFGNELDDCWCGGCARALATRDDRPAEARAVATPPPLPAPRPRAVIATIPTTPAAVPAAPDGLCAMLMAINRGGAVAPAGDVHDQAALDALFGDQA